MSADQNPQTARPSRPAWKSELYEQVGNLHFLAKHGVFLHGKHNILEIVPQRRRLGLCTLLVHVRPLGVPSDLTPEEIENFRETFGQLSTDPNEMPGARTAAKEALRHLTIPIAKNDLAGIPVRLTYEAVGETFTNTEETDDEGRVHFVEVPLDARCQVQVVIPKSAPKSLPPVAVPLLWGATGIWCSSSSETRLPPSGLKSMPEGEFSWHVRENERGQAVLEITTATTSHGLKGNSVLVVIQPAGESGPPLDYVVILEDRRKGWRDGTVVLKGLPRNQPVELEFFPQDTAEEGP